MPETFGRFGGGGREGSVGGGFVGAAAPLRERVQLQAGGRGRATRGGRREMIAKGFGV